MDSKKSFWETAPGVLTAIGGSIGAIAALLTALYTVGVIGSKVGPTPTPTIGEPSPSLAVSPAKRGATPLQQTADPAPTTDNARQAAQKLGADWFMAVKRSDVTTLVRMAEIPFQFGNTLLLRPEDVRQQYEKLLSAAGPKLETSQVQSIKVKTIAEAKNEGLHLKGDRFFDSLNLRGDDFVAFIQIVDGPSPINLYIRKAGSEVNLAGWIE